MTDLELETAPADWETRALCTDENCIGVLDASGHCNVCGRGGAGTAPFLRASSDEEQAAAPDKKPDEMPGEAEGADDDRELCLDESCIGVLGPDGACKVCGRRRSEG